MRWIFWAAKWMWELALACLLIGMPLLWAWTYL